MAKGLKRCARRHTFCCGFASVLLASSVMADTGGTSAKTQILPDFTLDDVAPTQNQSKDVNGQAGASPALISDANLDIRLQSAPQGLKEGGSVVDLDSLAHGAMKSKKQQQEHKDKERQKQEKEDEEKREQEESAAAEVEQQKRAAIFNEKERLLSVYEKRNKKYDYRKSYDYRKITQQDLLHKEKYGPNNTHLHPFITVDRYSGYLFIATMQEDVVGMKDLLARGADINARDKRNHYTPLLYAAYHHKNQSLSFLIVRGARHDLAGSDGKTALHMAAQEANGEAFEQLMIAGANVQAVDKAGKTPIFYATSIPKRLKIVALEKYKNKNSGLLESVSIGDVSLIKHFLTNGAYINTLDDQGNTPLMLAAIMGDAKVISLLLQYSPNLNATNIHGVGAVELAAQHKHEEAWVLIKSQISRNEMAAEPQ